MRACAHCGTGLSESAHRLRRYCNAACKRDAEAASYRRRQQARYVPRPCAQCGRTFKPTDGRQRYCAKACSALAGYERMKQDPDAWRAFLDRTGNVQHERRVRAQAGSDLTASQVSAMRKAARWCALCGCEMHRAAGKPDSKHLDHIVPLNVGGTHTQANTRIICALCNLTRPKDGSDLVGEQVALWHRYRTLTHETWLDSCRGYRYLLTLRRSDRT